LRQLKRVTAIINLKSLLVAGLAIVSMLVCRRFGLEASFPLTLVATAVVFPIVFSINGAYKRREAALQDYGEIKAHGRAIYFAVRDWLAERDPALEAEFRDLLGGFLKDCRDLFAHPVADMEEAERAVYARLSGLSRAINGLRAHGLAAGEVSRCNQFLSKMMISFETLKHIYQYRTPVTLRAYSDIFILLLPILYGPWFARIAVDLSGGLEFIMPVLMSLILVGLDNIQDHLENPFDQIGEDDIVFNAEKFVERLEL
jgi:predicted membrane chloride channel (bestrophin family)